MLPNFDNYSSFVDFLLKFLWFLLIQVQCLVNYFVNSFWWRWEAKVTSRVKPLTHFDFAFHFMNNQSSLASLSLSESSSSAKIVSCLPAEMAAAGVLSVNDILIFVYDDDYHRSQVVLCAKSAMSESHRRRWQSGAATFFFLLPTPPCGAVAEIENR